MISHPGHLVIAPIVVPLVAGALLLFFDDRRRRLKATVSVVAAVVLLVVSISLLRVAHGGEGHVAVYLLGNWPPPFAIVLVLDRLSAMMLALTASVAIPALIFSLARWHKAGPHFHTLFLFLLMGLNCAFLTGDLFRVFAAFRGDAGGIIWPGIARLGSVPCRGWHALHRDEPRRLAALPDRRVAYLRRHRHAQLVTRRGTFRTFPRRTG